MEEGETFCRAPWAVALVVSRLSLTQSLKVLKL